MVNTMVIKTAGQGLIEITDKIVSEVARCDVGEGLCTVFIKHTSASLLIQENADPSARRDLENWLNRLVPAGTEGFTHVEEGPDDMPSHIKSALTATSLSIPISQGQLVLGTWQGIFLWEHRSKGAARQVVIHVGG